MIFPRVIYHGPSGDAFDFNDGDVSILQGFTGLGPPAMNIQSVPLPSRHGEFYISNRMGPRLVSLDTLLNVSGWSNRVLKNTLMLEAVNQFVAGDDQLGRLEVQPSVDGATYSISAILYGPTDAAQREVGYQRATVAFWCPQPEWRATPGTTRTLSLSAAGLSVPLSVPVSFAGNVVDSDVTNNGHLETPVVITVLGPVTNPAITNNTTDKMVVFDLDIAHGDELVIDTASYSAVTRPVDGSAETNVLNAMSATSEMWTLARGLNTVTGSASAGDVQFSVFFYERYIGIDL